MRQYILSSGFKRVMGDVDGSKGGMKGDPVGHLGDPTHGKIGFLDMFGLV